MPSPVGSSRCWQHPDQFALFVAGPGSVDTATEEILRWVSPVIQFAYGDLRRRVGGQHIRNGDTVGIFYPSANRDERVFDEPYRFDITRSPNYHQAFGHGAHFCLGANLARWELRATLRALIPLLPRLELVGDPTRFGMLHLGIVQRHVVSPLLTPPVGWFDQSVSPRTDPQSVRRWVRPTCRARIRRPSRSRSAALVLDLFEHDQGERRKEQFGQEGCRAIKAVPAGRSRILRLTAMSTATTTTVRVVA